MGDEKTIYDLKLHEIFKTQDFHVMRVPGGWLYRYWDYAKDILENCPTFVPYDNEFDTRKPNATPLPSSSEQIRDCGAA